MAEPEKGGNFFKNAKASDGRTVSPWVNEYNTARVLFIVNWLLREGV